MLRAEAITAPCVFAWLLVLDNKPNLPLPTVNVSLQSQQSDNPGIQRNCLLLDYVPDMLKLWNGGFA